jgi:Uma2 family endonuclease
MSTVLHIDSILEMPRLPTEISYLSDDQFFQFCVVNRKLRIERSAEGKTIIMSPTGGETRRRNAEVNRQLGNWAKDDGTGVTFDSNTEFRLPNGACRSPDACWIPKSRWERIPRSERERFPPICPDFVIELLSPSDNLEETKLKMQEYIANGARLGWLIDPATRRVWVYSADDGFRVLDRPESLSGDPVLPGFILDLTDIFS